jgi:hypothetical protein
MTSPRYLVPYDGASRRVLTDGLRPGSIVCVSDAPDGAPWDDRNHRFVRVLRVERVGARLVSLTVDWYGVPRTVAGRHIGIVGAMVAA